MRADEASGGDLSNVDDVIRVQVEVRRNRRGKTPKGGL